MGESTTNNKIYVVGVVIAIIVIIFCCVKYCQKPKNNVLVPGDIKPDVVNVIKITDSINGLHQNLTVTTDKAQIRVLQDSLQKILNKKAKLDPTIVIKYKESIEQRNLIGKYQDTLAKLIDSSMTQQQQIAAFNKIKDRLLLTPAKYSFENKWFKQSGVIDKKGAITIDSVSMLSEPYITVGEKGGGWFSRSTLGITIGDHNPGVTYGNLQSFQYTPKPRRWGITVGAGVFATPKGLTYGLGATMGYTITFKK